jgi:lipopolysaccharide transport system permease protein
VAVAENTVVIQASRGWAKLRLWDLWDFRDLLYFLVWREIKVRYKQTAIGIAWAVIQPLLTMVVFSLFFGKLAKVPSDGIPYPLFSMTGLVLWTFFSNGLAQSAASLVGNANLITKVYFPRLAIPISAVVSGGVDLAVGIALLLPMLWWGGIAPHLWILWAPAFILLTLITSLGVGFWLSALNVEYRDVRYIVPFLSQLWLFITPIAYPSSLLHGTWRTVYALNPMVAAVEGFRWALLGSAHPPSRVVASSTTVALLMFISGLIYFRRMEKTFADVV